MTLGVLVDITVVITSTVRNAVVVPTELCETTPQEVEQMLTMLVVEIEHDASGRIRAKAIESCDKFESFIAAIFEGDAACDKENVSQKICATSPL